MKIFSLCLTALLSLNLCACSSDEEEQTADQESSEVSLGDLTVKTEENGKSTMQFGDQASLSTGSAIDEEELGVPFYPGSRQLKDGSFKMETPESKSVAAQFESEDEAEEIAEFYKDKLGKPQMEMSASGTTTLSFEDKSRTVLISLERPEGKTLTVVQIQTHSKTKG